MPAFQAGNVGSNPTFRSILHGPYWQGNFAVNEIVLGSNPRWRANLGDKCYGSTAASKSAGESSILSSPARYRDSVRVSNDRKVSSRRGSLSVGYISFRKPNGEAVGCNPA